MSYKKQIQSFCLENHLMEQNFDTSLQKFKFSILAFRFFYATHTSTRKQDREGSKYKMF